MKNTLPKKSIQEYLGIAGYISLAALAFGWSAIILLFNHQPHFAIITAICAFFMDCLDGWVARKTKTESDFGRQLDSYIDLLNYSIFSAILFYLYIAPNILGMITSFIIVITGILRLVRFNIEGYATNKNTLYYEGIVVCHILLFSIILFLIQPFFSAVIKYLSAPAMIALAILQLSRIPTRKTNTYLFWLNIAIVIGVVTIIEYLWLSK